jgi:pimeloyl-ACP methyl ester carboxylesterase
MLREGSGGPTSTFSTGAGMGTITVGQEHDAPIDLYYEDHGDGPAVVLLHGWPLDSRSWEPQVRALLDAGHRVVSYDMRGFGRSSRPATGYDFDTLAADLDRVLTRLDLRDATLVGFSFGTGEAVRYIGRHGTERLRALVLIESLAPSFAKSDENPQGVDAAGVEAVQSAIAHDRYAWLTGLLGDLFNLNELQGTRISEETVRAAWNAASEASPLATSACPPGWLEDYREDVRRIDVPTLILHGTADRILPIEGQARALHRLLPDAAYAEIEGGPHAVCVTHAPEVNRALLDFLAAQR